MSEEKPVRRVNEVVEKVKIGVDPAEGDDLTTREPVAIGCVAITPKESWRDKPIVWERMTDQQLQEIRDLYERSKAGFEANRHEEEFFARRWFSDVPALLEEITNEDRLLERVRSLGYEVTDPHEPGSEA
jgi:hypothetical protein